VPPRIADINDVHAPVPSHRPDAAAPPSDPGQRYRGSVGSENPGIAVEEARAKTGKPCVAQKPVRLRPGHNAQMIVQAGSATSSRQCPGQVIADHGHPGRIHRVMIDTSNPGCSMAVFLIFDHHAPVDVRPRIIGLMILIRNPWTVAWRRNLRHVRKLPEIFCSTCPNAA